MVLQNYTYGLMVETFQSSFPPSPNFYRLTVGFNMLIKTNFFFFNAMALNSILQAVEHKIEHRWLHPQMWIIVGKYK